MCVGYSCNSNHLPLTALPPTPTSQCNWNPLVFFIHFSSCHASNITSSNQKGVVCNLEAACVGGMNIKITELAKLRPTKLEIGTGLPVYHQVISGLFIWKMPSLHIFQYPAWNMWNINDQEQIEQLELGMAKVIADFRAQAEEVGKRRFASHTTGFATSVYLMLGAFLDIWSEGHGFFVDFWFKSGFQIFFLVL